MFFTKKVNVEGYVHPLQKTDIDAMESAQDKLNFLQMRQKDLLQLKKLTPLIEEYVQPITERHYEMLQQFRGLDEIIQTHSTVDRLSKTFVQYLRSIPEADFGAGYIRSRAKIGQIHSKIKLTPEWYTGSYMRVYEYLIPAIISEYRNQPSEMADILLALLRAITFDSQIVLDSYQSENDFKVVDGQSQVMEIMMGIDQVKDVLDKVEHTKHESEGVSTAAEQLTASVEDVAKAAVGVAENTENTVQQANKGQEVIENSLKGFLTMADDFMDMKEKISTLSDEMKKVADVVQFIRGVAEQTNLLALNASIEAARAGEQGKGFAVVAEEVRKLAEETTKSVNKITETMQGIVKEAVDVGDMSNNMSNQLNTRVEQAQDSLSAIDQIVTNIQSIGKEINNIAAISEEQSVATEDISKRIFEVLTNVNDIEESVNLMGQNVYEASVRTDKSRRDSIKSIQTLQDRHILRIVKTEHKLWKWWLYNAALGYHHISESELVDAHKCRLGKWYDAMERSQSEITGLQAFKLLKDPHQRVHDIAKQIFRDIKARNEENLEKDFQLLDEASQEVVQLLDEIYHKVDSL
ncbi:methyl-accepting chemotaxis protein [Bacillus tianshenii]|nr:methyl-accepting chemotaxis protein [Bacillus tianshenii]